MTIICAFIYGLRLTDEDIFKVYPKEVLKYLNDKAIKENIQPFKSLPSPGEVWDSNVGFSINDLIQSTDLLEIIESEHDLSLIGQNIDYDNGCSEQDPLDNQALFVFGVKVQVCEGKYQLSSGIPSVTDSHRKKWSLFTIKCPQFMAMKPELFMVSF